MADYRTFDEFYVKIEIDTHRWGRERSVREMSEDAQDIISQVKRHVDFCGSIYYDSESRILCGFCHLDPEREADGFPLCCTDAEWEWMGEIANDFH